LAKYSEEKKGRREGIKEKKEGKITKKKKRKKER
jgi:hypothetical protein